MVVGQSLLYGSQSSNASYSQEVLTFAQLIQFNTTNSKNSWHYHLKNNKPPLPVYIGLLDYSRTRKRDLIDTQYELGLSISYDWILKILDTTKNIICAQYEKDDAVCPPNLRNGLFTTSAVDNIDHNTSFTHSKDNFHGTDISLFQHPPIKEPGVDRNVLCENLDYKTPKRCLPESYTNVLPLHNPNDKPPTLISQRTH